MQNFTLMLIEGPLGTVGNPFYECAVQEIVKAVERVDPCTTANCGSFAECRNIRDQAVCSCLIGYYGQPPNCRPECVISPDCPYNKACSREKCMDPVN